MPSKLSLYSDILQLRTGAFLSLKESNHSLRYALQVLVLVTLLAGAGKLTGLSTLYAQPTTPQVVQEFSTLVSNARASMVNAVPRLLPIYVEVWFPLDIEPLIVHYIDNAFVPLERSLQGTEDLALQLEPPVGEQTSRAVQLVGDWLATPLQWLNRWLLFALVTLLLAKYWGGVGTLRQHISLLVLASAPYIFMFPAYMPHDGPIGMAVGFYGRVLALLVAAWAAAIGIKAIATAHNLTATRAAGIVALGFLVHYVLAPLVVAGLLIYLVV